MTSTLLAYIGSFCGIIAVIPQIIRIIQLKEAHALSYTFLYLRLISFALIMLATIIEHEYWIASSYILLILTNAYLIYLKFYYR